jgi:dihydroneopterin triphosphate diphosphatase
MMRTPMQILVLPFRKNTKGDYEFAVFKRADAGFWHGIAGGGEDNEIPVETAVRESSEEAGIPINSKFYPLQFKANVPVSEFAASKYWSKDIYVVPEHYFAVECKGIEIVLSHEHTEFKWVSYNEALNLLKWDSNKTALWELNERLKNNDL